MSYTIYNPAPGTWGAMRSGTDIDTRTISFAGVLAGTSDVIATVSAVNIVRNDAALMTSSDLALSGTPVVNALPIPASSGPAIPAGQAVTVPLVAGTAGGTYDIEVVVVTVASRTIGRDVAITVSDRVG